MCAIGRTMAQFGVFIFGHSFIHDSGQFVKIAHKLKALFSENPAGTFKWNGVEG